MSAAPNGQRDGCPRNCPFQHPSVYQLVANATGGLSAGRPRCVHPAICLLRCSVGSGPPRRTGILNDAAAPGVQIIRPLRLPKNHLFGTERCVFIGHICRHHKSSMSELSETRPNGRWVRDVTFARITGLSRQTLANWRAADKRAGRTGPAEGYPIYRRFGRAVRYWLPDDGWVPGQAAQRGE